MTDHKCIVKGCLERVLIIGYDDVALCAGHCEELEEWERAVARQFEAVDGVDQMKHTCPRRVTGLGPWQRNECLDGWRYQGPSGVLISDRMKHCNFCGSLHPDTFMEMIKKGSELGPTDKSYKVYLKLARGQTKFYFQHLSVEQCVEFVDLLNAGKLNIGYPGHFYVRPFFVRAVT